MVKKCLCKCLFIILINIVSPNVNAQFAKYINPFIGTGGTGHTFPGATTPFAMVQLSPDTRIDGSWEGCSGYHYNDSIIYGFSHTHLSGTGCSDYGDIAFMPWFSKSDEFDILKAKNLQSKFSHKNEKASAGYYSVLLDEINVKVELTATTRTGFQQYTFNDDGFGYIVLNLKHRDELLQGSINEKETLFFSGIRRSKAWAKNQELYYASKISILDSGGAFSEPFRLIKKYNNNNKLVLCFKIKKGNRIIIKTGLSSCDEYGAENNLKTESLISFESARLNALESWEKELKKIEVQDAKNKKLTKDLIDKLTVFYTAMYHCMIHPSIMNDVDGRYRGRDGQIHKAEGFNYYTVFSLWDTHRALHPLLNIIDKKRSHDFVITFLKQFEQIGRLPMWELWNNETDCMIGFHSVSVILDAYRKEVITKDELQQLWPAVKTEAMSNRFGLDKFREKGYLSVEDESESVSKTAEYSYDMWCVSEIASELKLLDDRKYFRKLQYGFENLYNPKTQFIQPRKNGNWLQNFNPYEVNNNYTEANAWQYSFYHPHQSWTNQKMLDSLFKVNTKTVGREQADITGMIGQYAHGNEPSHNYIYLLNNTNRIKYLKYVYDSFYTNKPKGLIGNEDCGQMSAWYVMSGLGFYQSCPGGNHLDLGLPIFKNVILNLSNDKQIKIEKEFDDLNFNAPFCFSNEINQRDDILDHNQYVSIITSDIGFLEEFKFTNTLDKPVIPRSNPFGSADGLRDCCTNKAPLIYSEEVKPFIDSTKISINYLLEGDSTCNKSIYYCINKSKFKKYEKPFFIHSNSTISAFAITPKHPRVYSSSKKPDTSNFSRAHFYKRPNNYSIQLNCKYNKQYTADGDDGIIDGQYGDIDWKKGGWQGYQAQDFEAVIDMKETKNINEISANFLQDTRSWILFPTKVEYYISDDNINFQLVGTTKNTIDAKDYNNQVQKLKINVNRVKSRYIKVKAFNYGKLPEWHAGKGDDAFIFIDEIEIK